MRTAGNRFPHEIRAVPDVREGPGFHAVHMRRHQLALPIGVALAAWLLLAATPGLASGPTLVKDIFPGATGSISCCFAHIGNTLLFWATSPTHFGLGGRELWRSGGTKAGTVQVAEINVQGSADPETTVGPLGTVIGSTLYFAARDSLHGVELWRSDGTFAGTALVKDIRPGAGSSEPQWLVNVGGTLLFTADDGVHGEEIWKSDGTAAGTKLVKDIWQGTGSVAPRYLASVGGTLFFNAADGDGRELWKSNGTAAGTKRVKDILPGPLSSDPWHLANFNGTLVFNADDGVHGPELWKSNGTQLGTTRIKDIRPGPHGSQPHGFGTMGGAVYFSADDGVHGFELWKSDGTAPGTKLVRDIWAGPDDSYPAEFVRMGSTLFFVNEAFGELWKSDGSEAGTKRVKNLTLDPYNLTRAGDKLIFAGYLRRTGVEPWTSDGTAAGTKLIADLNPGTGGSLPSIDVSEPDLLHPVGFRAGLGGVVYFAADDGTHGRELWKYVP